MQEKDRTLQDEVPKVPKVALSLELGILTAHLSTESLGERSWREKLARAGFSTFRYWMIFSQGHLGPPDNRDIYIMIHNSCKITVMT